ncbi:MAG: Gldg family protein [Pseudomonadota bacterium]|uniref:Gldg family protein n=1 Tax=Methylophaga aminisulfidivorans TaxID=230105 RepID=UPI0024E19A4B|nr:Gldg family protein [Methylophaga aminisulfidivorans]MEC9411335.1 Gldg family protein [Pseudomonadota bacterium]
MNKQLLSATGLILAIILFVSFNIVVNGNFKSARVDLTEDNLYTLSDGTVNILKSMKEPISLRFYYTEKAAQALPSLKSYAQRVQELLLEYQRASNGKIRLFVMNPEPFSSDEQRADQYGLQSVPIDGESDPLYFGLAGTNEVDGVETIPFFQPEKEDTLEYDLTKLIYKLSNNNRKTVGVISSLEVDGEQYDPLKGEVASADGAKPWAMMAELRQMFNVSMLPTDVRRIPSSMDALVVIHPKELSESTLYAIDQYVLAGGKLITFVDPYAEVDKPKKDPDNPMSAMLAPRSSNMDELFEAWGFKRSNTDVVADRKTATKVDFGAKTDYQPIDYVLWQKLTKGNFNKDERITSALRQLNVATPGRFEILDGHTTKITPLFSSSNEAMLVDKRVVQFRNDPVALLTKYQPGTISYPMAIRAQGEVKTAFPDGAKTVSGELKKMPGHLDKAKSDIDVIAIADVDMLDDRFWVETQDFYGKQLAFNTSNNIDLLINAIEDMTGSEGLISIRSRAGFSRPFYKVIELQRDAEKRFRTKERELQNKLKETQQRIARMQVQRSGSGQQILSPEQQKEIAEFRLTANKTQQQLRDVQANLRKDIDKLDAQLKFFNIGLVPILVGLLAVFTGWMRIRKRNKARSQQ